MPGNCSCALMEILFPFNFIATMEANLKIWSSAVHYFGIVRKD